MQKEEFKKYKGEVMEERFVKAEALLLEEGFQNELKRQENDDDVIALFSKHGVELSKEDIEQMCEESKKVYMRENEEIKEEDLEYVAGGFVTTLLFMASAASISFYISYGIKRHKKRR